MPYALGRVKIQDYAKFKAAFDEYGATRKANGSKGARIFRNADEPNEVAILIEWEDLQKARQFFQSQGLREQMQRAGLVGSPDIRFLDQVDRTTE
ncbi:MAG: putative quinol monooxygenase [Candidatus Binatia bacterium]